MQINARQTIFCSAIYFFLSLISLVSFSQTYILNGSATQNTCNCYTLTQASNFQSGSVWNTNKISLENPFDFWFNVYLGCQDDNGADGIVFMLQPISTSVGVAGEGMGFEGITPSIGISLDTWQNTNRNDPPYDHISIQSNGTVTHGTDLAAPVPISVSSDNVEDCKWHVLRISWDPATKWLRSYFDGALRVETQVDLIANIFKNDPMVFWGFSAATGGSNNVQQFCTALNPGFTSNLPGNVACFPAPAVTFTDRSVSFAPIQSWYWDFGDGTSSTLQNPPAHTYSSPGIYEMKQVISGLDGCISDTLKQPVSIGSKPVADFDVYDTCAKKPPGITDKSTNDVGDINQWTWMVDGVTANSLSDIPAGTHQLQLVVKSIYGCESNAVSKTVVMKPAPLINASVNDGCADEPVSFNASQTDNATNITQWNWDLGNGQSSAQPSLTYSYSNKGNYITSVWAQADNGCISDTFSKTIFINKAIAFAGNDTVGIKDYPIQLKGSGGTTYSWSPATGLNNPNIENPIAVLQDNITYTMTAITPEGCTDADDISITIFKGVAIYVPTGFTPNNDGKNDILRPKYIGIKKLDYFRIYNRWGELVFTTNKFDGGWNGRTGGADQQTGVYVWVLRAEDITGKIWERKGTTTLIK